MLSRRPKVSCLVGAAIVVEWDGAWDGLCVRVPVTYFHIQIGKRNHNLLYDEQGKLEALCPGDC